jgi:hypothetical protein
MRTNFTIRTKDRIRILIFILTIILSGSLSAELVFVSWNIRDFGKRCSDEVINEMAQMLRHADIVAIQEVVAKDPGGAKINANWKETKSIYKN